MFPLFLDLTDRLTVVVGGGSVGRRRAASLRAAGARTRLVCLEPRPDGEADTELEWLTEPYTALHLQGAFLALAAATPVVNEQVVADARGLGILVNCSSNPRRGDFAVPAVVRRGDLLVALSTGGASPTLTRLLRDTLAAEFDDSFAVWTRLLAELRPIVQARTDSMDRRRELLARLCRWHWLERLRCENPDHVREAMLAEVSR